MQAISHSVTIHGSRTNFVGRCFHTKFVAVGQTIWASVGGRSPKNSGDAGIPPLWNGDRLRSLETCFYLTCRFICSFFLHICWNELAWLSTEPSRSVATLGGSVILGVFHARVPRGGDPASPIVGFLYTYTIWRRRIKFGMVTHIGRGMSCFNLHQWTWLWIRFRLYM